MMNPNDPLIQDVHEALGEARWLVGKLAKLLEKMQSSDPAPPIVVAGPLSFLETRLQRHAVEAESRVLTHSTCAAPCGTCFDEPPGEAA